MKDEPKVYRSIRESCEGHATLTDKLIISDQLVRIEFLLGEILAELRLPR